MLFQVHLWAGILLSAYLSVIGVTGSLLVFEDEFTTASLSRKATERKDSSTLRLADVVHAAEQASAGMQPYFLSFPESHVPFYRIWMKNTAGQQSVIAIDAATGRALPGSRPWIEWVHDLHIYLLLGPSGLVVNGIGACCLLLLSLTGIVLWWPGLSRWTRGLRVNLRSNWRRINFDLHSAVGFWSLTISAWWAISGIYFAWPVQFSHAVSIVSPLKGMRPPALAQEHVSVGGRIDLESMVSAARQATPGGTISGLALPTSARGNVIVYVDRRQAGDFSHRDIHYFSGNTGRLLATWHYGENSTAGDWILWAMHPLHFGTLWGLGPKIAWALLGLSLPALSITGILMYWNRKLRFVVSRRFGETAP